MTFADMRRMFAAPLPELGRDSAAAIDELAALAEAGLGAMAGPRFFGWVVGGSHPVGVAADWLTSAWGQNCGGHTIAPAGAACEEVAASWLLELFDLPRECSVGFATGATMANLACLAAARGEVLRRAHWDVEDDGLPGAPSIRVIVGEETHASIFSVLQILGLGSKRLVRMPTDRMGRMDLGSFEAAIGGSDGPAIVITQAGHINTGAFDPIGQICEIAHRHAAWVHVDGAFGLWARACPERAALAAGLDRADSWATDGHKWLQLPYDCGFAIVRDAEAHRRAMTIAASYLPNASEGERNPSHYVPELSRRARGFAAWAMIRTLGRQGIQQMIARHCRIARQMAQALAREAGIRILNEIVLNQVAVRFGGDDPSGDTLTSAVIARVQEDGTCFAAGAQWKGLWIMRLSVISWGTTEQDADRSVAAIISAWRAVQAEAA
ncbi:MAG TPA: aspartate aminotransferase family protein [Dongiaceae bacterium]|nr:aspartate aminotransferase family protein [Dongiaceae bacterium]